MKKQLESKENYKEKKKTHLQKAPNRAYHYFPFPIWFLGLIHCKNYKDAFKSFLCYRYLEEFIIVAPARQGTYYKMQVLLFTKLR